LSAAGGGPRGTPDIFGEGICGGARSGQHQGAFRPCFATSFKLDVKSKVAEKIIQSISARHNRPGVQLCRWMDGKFPTPRAIRHPFEETWKRNATG
jgi:hypothetical protein